MQIILNIPPDVNLGMSEFDFKMTIGVALYEKGIMSSGLAAEILGIERRDFITAMANYGKTIFEKTEDELKEDIVIAKQFIQ